MTLIESLNIVIVSWAALNGTNKIAIREKTAGAICTNFFSEQDGYLF